MQYTTKLKLKKPDLTDYVNIADINDNMEILDTEIAKMTDAETGVEAKIDKKLTPLNEAFTQHLGESMPHRFIDNGKTYRWGFRTVNGEPQMIYEEVTT